MAKRVRTVALVVQAALARIVASAIPAVLAQTVALVVQAEPMGVSAVEMEVSAEPVVAMVA
jgi:hypothetical protein